MIDHERALELATSALDFELSSADRTELRLHLASCDPCRASSDALSADARTIEALSSHDAPGDLRGRILGPTPATDDAATDRGASEPGPRAARSSPFRDRRVVALLASAAVVVALIGGTLVWRSTRSDDHGVAATSPSPALPNGSGGPPTGTDGSPGASQTPGSSGPVTAGVWKAVATLTSDGPSNGVLGLDSTFRLTSLDATPAAELAKGLRVDPPIALAVTPEPDGTGVRLTPSRPLTPGTVYRFTLSAPDGRTLDSWAFQAEQPLSVVSTLPEDHETDVPLDTGIEVTFDQDGVTDAASHMTVTPKTSGHFEQHGRVLVFVPDRLRPRTVYTVTVAKGVSTAPGGAPMERDVRFEFETTNPGTTYEPSAFSFADDLYESATSSRPVISLWVEEDSHGRSPDSVKIDVYRLDGLDAAIGAFRHIRADPGWSRWSTTHLVPTGDLPKVLSVDARLRGDRNVGRAHWFTLPEPLPPGWYVIEQPSKTQPIQAVLQVTDIASYLVVSDTKTLVWANDLSTGGSIKGATVRSGDVVLGRTGPDGVAAAATPVQLGRGRRVR